MSLEEIANLRSVVARNLADASVASLHPDTRFRLAYEAALVVAKRVVAGAGYRVKGHGAHHATFAGLEIAMGAEVMDAADFFDRCRRTRNVIDYVRADVVIEDDVADVILPTNELCRMAEAWIQPNHPELGAGNGR